MRTLLIVGAGDVARRALPSLARRWRVLATCRSPQAAASLRAAGVLPIPADLDHAASLSRLAGLADALLLTAPPLGDGMQDARTHKLLSALAKAERIPQRIVYISTSGVYGDAGGGWCPETRPPAPDNARAWRRLDAERQLRRFAGRHGCQLTILRAPGIYADERLPLGRFASGAPLIRPEEDSWSNHIHADDLAGLCVAALRRRASGARVYNASDCQPLPISEWYRRLAAALGLPMPALLPRDEVRASVSPLTWSYLRESRRLDNRRLMRELGYRLRWPEAAGYLAQLAQDETRRAKALATMPKIR